MKKKEADERSSKKKTGEKITISFYYTFPGILLSMKTGEGVEKYILQCRDDGCYRVARVVVSNCLFMSYGTQYTKGEPTEFHMRS